MPCETTKLSGRSNNSTVLVQKENQVVEAIDTVLSYTDTFEDDYNISFVDTRTWDTAKDMITSFLLSRESYFTYLHYERVDKLVMKHEAFPAYVEKVSAEKDLRFHLGVTHLDEFQLNGQLSEEVLLLVHGAHQYRNNPKRLPCYTLLSSTTQGCPR